MPPKKHLPQPIDRPLSRAYLRQFKGWSTAYPPGVSDPASLRVMENMLVNRDGSVRIRPGLERMMGLGAGFEMVGSYEPFYLNNGKKAYLFAVRETGAGDIVTFRVGVPDETDGYRWDVITLTTAPASFDVTGWGADLKFSSTCTYVKYVQIDNKILALSNNGEEFIVFAVGAEKKVLRVEYIPYPSASGGAPTNTMTVAQPQSDWVTAGDQSVKPLQAASYSATTLISTGTNDYRYGFFFTYSNAIGESAPSIPEVISASRGWGSWLAPAPTNNDTAAPIPGTVDPTSPGRAADQLIVYIQSGVDAGFDEAVALGATALNLYMFSWSSSAPVPVEAELIAVKELTSTSTRALDGWVQVLASNQSLGVSRPLPDTANQGTFLANTGYNSTGPSKAAQGLVAADRLVLVNDPTAAAVIRWTSNNQGDYLNFDPLDGGGFKTLTSGNMQTPACVKLWQNPQSADTLTILNMGTDGYSTAYYMMPASVTSQSDNTVIMGFEETTATPGTVSPYGCEVANNALYHPLDDQLMKSTASNYNINHKAMTDQIVNKWTGLLNKHKIVSCFFDQRLYFLVHNPDGEALLEGSNGNELWVLDLASEGGSWSRWLTQGVSLKKTEVAGRVYLSLVAVDGVYVFDETRATDDYPVTPGTYDVRNIPWQLVTNTQGANRAHDAWSHLRQVSIIAGNFTGQMSYGVIGKDQHGMVIDISKEYEQTVNTGGEPFDAEDHLRIAREMKEWYFHAGSLEAAGVVQPSSGQLSLVQYRYTPVSVNVGYDFGSVETFEYGRAEAGALSFTDNGIPQPYLDTSRP